MRSTGEPLNDLVSVVVPVYNAALYLDACVNSLINQSYGNIEIILVEDHSTDNSLEVCRKYAQAEPRIRLIVHEKNTGYGVGRNDGIDVANGKWVMLLDADDEYLPDAVEKMVRSAQKYDAQVVFAEFYYVYDDNTRKVEKCIIPEGAYSRAEFASMCLTKLTWEYLSYPCVKIYSKVFLDEHRIRLSEYHDGTFLIDALSYADRVGVLNEPIALYNVREGTISRSLRLNMYEFFSEVDNRLEKFFIDCKVMDDEHYIKTLEKHMVLVKASLRNPVKYGKYKDFSVVFDQVSGSDSINKLYRNKLRIKTIRNKVYLLLLQMRARFLLYLLILC